MYFFDQDDLTTITVGQILLRAADEISFPPKASKPRLTVHQSAMSAKRERKLRLRGTRLRATRRSETAIEREEDREDHLRRYHHVPTQAQKSSKTEKIWEIVKILMM